MPPDFSSLISLPLSHIRQKPPQNNAMFKKWNTLLTKIDKPQKTLNIGVIAKYFQSGNFSLKDSYASVIEAVNHSAWARGCKPVLNWIVSDNLDKNPALQESLKKYDGLIVPQGWGSRGVEGKIKAVEIARNNKIPYLGLCFGMQMAVIEYARNVAHLKDANSTEVNPKTPAPVINIMESQKQNILAKKYGGTIRLGGYPCKLKEDSLLYSLYKNNKSDLFPKLPVVNERHRHRYEFNNDYKEILEKSGLKIVGTSPDGSLVEAIELDKKIHPFFVGTQYHPELKSHFTSPHPIFLGFIDACIKRQQANS